MSNYSRVCPAAMVPGAMIAEHASNARESGTSIKRRSPGAWAAFNLTVTFINGSQNRPVMWARDRQKAIEIITAYCAVKGWEVSSIE